MAGRFLQEPIRAVGEVFVGTFGLGGIFVGQVALDSLPFTVSEPLLLAGYDGGLGFWALTTVAGLGSFCAGIVGWGLGKLLGTWSITRQLFARYRVDAFMARYGAAFVAVGAITPFPYSITTYAAGATGMPLWQLCLSSLLRFPKTWGYMGLVVWSYYGGAAV